MGLKLFVFYCLATFRTLEIGNDTIVYYSLFSFISGSRAPDMHALSYRYEIGYLWLNQAISYITDNFWVFLAIVTAIIYYAYYKFIEEYSENSAFSVFLFFILGFWGHTVNILRLQLALAMAIFAFLAFRKKKKLQTVLFMILAISFQRIAVVYILSFFIPPKIDKRIYTILLATSLAVLLFLPKILAIVAMVVPYFQVYLTDKHLVEDAKLASIIGILIRLIFFIFSLYVFKTHDKDLSVKEQETFIYQINMIFISLLIMIISMRFSLLDRCQAFNWIFIITLIPNTLNLLKNWRNKVITFVAIMAFCISYFLVINIYRPGWNHIYPYKTVLLEDR
ncbi:EpsG family protein [Streptococcus pneumoniae]